MNGIEVVRAQFLRVDDYIVYDDKVAHVRRTSEKDVETVDAEGNVLRITLGDRSYVRRVESRTVRAAVAQYRAKHPYRSVEHGRRLIPEVSAALRP